MFPRCAKSLEYSLSKTRSRKESSSQVDVRRREDEWEGVSIPREGLRTKGPSYAGERGPVVARVPFGQRAHVLRAARRSGAARPTKWKEDSYLILYQVAPKPLASRVSTFEKTRTSVSFPHSLRDSGTIESVLKSHKTRARRLSCSSSKSRHKARPLYIKLETEWRARLSTQRTRARQRGNRSGTISSRVATVASTCVSVVASHKSQALRFSRAFPTSALSKINSAGTFFTRKLGSPPPSSG